MKTKRTPSRSSRRETAPRWPKEPTHVGTRSVETHFNALHLHLDSRASTCTLFCTFEHIVGHQIAISDARKLTGGKYTYTSMF